MKLFPRDNFFLNFEQTERSTSLLSNCFAKTKMLKKKISKVFRLLNILLLLYEVIKVLLVGNFN